MYRYETIHVRVNSHEKESIESLADKLQISVSELIRDAVNKYLTSPRLCEHKHIEYGHITKMVYCGDCGKQFGEA